MISTTCAIPARSSRVRSAASIGPVARSTWASVRARAADRSDSDPAATVKEADLIAGGYLVLRKGKRTYHLLSFAAS